MLCSSGGEFSRISFALRMSCVSRYFELGEGLWSVVSAVKVTLSSSRAVGGRDALRSRVANSFAAFSSAQVEVARVRELICMKQSGASHVLYTAGVRVPNLAIASRKGVEMVRRYTLYSVLPYVMIVCVESARIVQMFLGSQLLQCAHVEVVEVAGGAGGVGDASAS